ncbi:precorrin-3B C(17)-methyltransferase [Halovibrio salipaludis]|uniref:Precorrin-3B C(17)-methyltransferase n=1 Tax=Halovibrio salipaludis TaxID=2032626 RepID=A0A2A2FB20_9GAMM|nr:precorrin-3B C(17)-methyltransferase [Halovibrio salipaludis]PAU81819.1 precorrin-3B C(17)-methyltransferase [Halovibrio salipaludis]
MKRLDVIGVGPAGPGWITPETQSIIDAATDLVGYAPYLDRLASERHHCHPSDNRVELERAAQAMDLAAEGRHVAVVSGGDPGVFAMAAALCEVLDRDPRAEWAEVEFGVHPGISALQAAAARVGAPLGHDFCAISLSDNLKPWSVIARRLQLAAQADFAMAFYNPRSSSRPWQLGEALGILRGELPGATPVVFAAAVGRPDEWVRMTTLAEADPEEVDMRTLVIVGNSRARYFAHGDEWFVYSPRDYL